MKRLLAFFVAMLMGLMCVTVTPAVGLAEGHWAQAEVDTLVAKLGWRPPADLNAPISPAAWNELMALVLGIKPGPAAFDENYARYSAWTYTGGMSKTETIERQHAIGGLVKLLFVFYNTDLAPGGANGLAHVTDRDKVVDWQRPLVEKAVAASLVYGYPGGELRPAAPLLGGEAAVLAARMIERFASITPWAPDGVIPVPTNRGGAGALMAEVLGAAYASALPGVGEPEPGHLWVLLDVKLENHSQGESLPLATGVAFSIEDGPAQLYHIEMDRAASTAVGSPFAAPEGVLAPGYSLRGKVAFAVPAGTKAFWFRLDHSLGRSPGKDQKWTGMSRFQVGDLPDAR